MKNSVNYLFIGMISLLVSMCTFRKQWTFFEVIKSIDDILSKDFAVITPKKIMRLISMLAIAFVCCALSIVVAIAFYTYDQIMGTQPYYIVISYFLANLPYYCIVMVFYSSTSSITRRFYYVNNILRQLSPQHIPKKVFELCSRSVNNERLKPTIELNEIYSVYGSYLKKNLAMTPPSKGFNNQDDIKKEIKKLTIKLENREESIWEKLKRRNVIEVEEFKLSKMRDPDDVIELLTKLLDIHDSLLDCINIQNEILSFQILLMVAQIFIFEVFALFSLYRTLYSTEIESNVLAFTNVLWLCAFNLILFLIMHTAAQCVNEGKLTGTYCHKVINKVSHSVDPRIIEKVKEFKCRSSVIPSTFHSLQLSVMSHQLTLRTPNITCGLFSFDWELIFSMISATTIYLVFLMQFDVAGNANKEKMS